MKRFVKLIAMVFALTMLMSSVVFAAGWTNGQGEKSDRWWYDLGNGTWYGTSDAAVEWQWLDGNGDGIAESYAFDNQGWMYADTVTPDGYSVNEDGAWTLDGVVQTMSVAAGYAGTRAQNSQSVDAGEKILIAYFSKTGTTEAAAREIQAVTGGDLFEITVSNPYPSSYQSTVDRARNELDSNARPELSSRVENMDEYDVILLGYPIWWHTAPMAIDTFLESYDLSGKIVLSFATSAGSSVSESMADIQRIGAERGASVGTGITANSLSQSVIEAWFSENGIEG